MKHFKFFFAVLSICAACILQSCGFINSEKPFEDRDVVMYESAGTSNDFLKYKIRVDKIHHTFVIWEASNNAIRGGSGFTEYHLCQKGTFEGDNYSGEIELNSDSFELGNFAVMENLSETGVTISGRGPGRYHCYILSEEECQKDPLFKY